MSNKNEELENTILDPVLNITKRFYLLVIFLSFIILIGAIGWFYQLRDGLGVTGLSHRVFWGLYISNFIFFIGISYSGTLLSAILRLTGAGWRTPLTRMAEIITVIGIVIGFAMILIDVGRPDRILLVFFSLRLESPLFWDSISVLTYLVGSSLFLYLPLIPDIAFLRDKLKDQPGYRFRKVLYRILALGWSGNHSQKHRLEKAISIMSIVLIPVAIICHTVIAFIFALTWRVGWHSTIFGPFFVVAAVFSGTAALLVVMAIARKIYHFEEIITYRQFRNLGYILFALLGTYLYFTITEYFTTGYRGVKEDIELLEEIFFGEFAPLFWFFLIPGMIIPGFVLLVACWKYESEKAVWAIAGASLLIVLGMYVKRFIIVIPALSRPFVAQQWTTYNPTWIEWAITIAAVAGIIMAYAVFSKLFPIISIWEIKEENKKIKS
ncbi:MAG: NrfD/PsrC family molybdoenzyme membrane anchor subunit [Candidatus Hodarchaeales archaeon]|jgi:molybdopterin-containing oxidoreductase family membrane subunit